MTPEQNEAFVRLTTVLRKPGPLSTLLREVAGALAEIVPLEAVRFDIADAKGDNLWSRICRPDAESGAFRIGVMLRLKSKEEKVVEEDRVSLPLGFGNHATGRIIVKREGGLSEEEIEALERCADLFTLALRARPLEPKPKPRNPFDEPKVFF